LNAQCNTTNNNWLLIDGQPPIAEYERLAAG
jgi:hypothetical protein